MDVIHFVCKSIFSISFIKRKPVCLGGHDGKAVLFQYPCHIFHAIVFRYFDHHINNVFSPYFLNGSASDMTDSGNMLIR